MRTVRDFKTYFMQKNNARFANDLANSSLREFWQKLNRLGSAKKTKAPEECDDIDATAPLTDEEWNKLDAEFHKITRW